jgi:hypothetical protein
LTVDYGREVVIVETRGTLAARYADGVPVSVDVQRDGPSVTMFMPLTIPGGRSISVEIDMGSDELILDERLAEETGASLDGDGVRRVEGTDEIRTSCSSGSSMMASSATPSCGNTWSRSMFRAQRLCSASPNRPSAPPPQRKRRSSAHPPACYAESASANQMLLQRSKRPVL